MSSRHLVDKELLPILEMAPGMGVSAEAHRLLESVSVFT